MMIYSTRTLYHYIFAYVGLFQEINPLWSLDNCVCIWVCMTVSTWTVHICPPFTTGSGLAQCRRWPSSSMVPVNVLFCIDLVMVEYVLKLGQCFPGYGNNEQHHWHITGARIRALGPQIPCKNLHRSEALHCRCMTNRECDSLFNFGFSIKAHTLMILS